MKKRNMLILVLMAALLLSACSSKPKAGGQVKITEENKSYISQYDKSLQADIKEMNEILESYNNSLDGLYTQQYSRGQFAQILKTCIEKSNKLVTKVERVDVNPDLFEANQNLIVLVNRSHQLLLTSIEMANQEDRDIDKEALRNEYLEIKKSQAEIANQWKLLRIDLESEGTKK